MHGKTVLITGATRGIGFEAAKALAAKGATVILHGRDPSRLEQARRKITADTGSTQHSGVVADLAVLDDVRRLAAEVGQGCDRLDVLLNNAGLVTRKREQTADGFERQFAVNHLAPFLLTNLLLDKLKASDAARVVTVASNAHHRSDFDLNDLHWEHRRYDGIKAYGATKLANILFTRELAKRLDGSNVTANCLHPGVVATHIFSGMGLLGAVFGIVTRPFMLSATAGAHTSIYLASDAAIGTTSGHYFSQCEPVMPAKAALDDAAAAELWDLSAAMTGIDASHR